MGITNELKSKALVVNQVCYVITLVVNIVFFLCSRGLFKTIIHDGFGTMYSTARIWSVVMIIVGIAASILFSTLWYYLIKIYIKSKDVG